jgi:hypothetical protein
VRLLYPARQVGNRGGILVAGTVEHISLEAE